MPRLKILSGEDVIKILEYFDFAIISQKGSHVKLQRKLNNIKQTLIIPSHKEIDKGTLWAIFNQVSKYISPVELEKYFYQE